MFTSRLAFKRKRRRPRSTASGDGVALLLREHLRRDDMRRHLIKPLGQMRQEALDHVWQREDAPVLGSSSWRTRALVLGECQR